MKVKRKEEAKKFVRITFGYSYSMAFEDTTIQDVYDLMIMVFSNHKVSGTIEIKDHNPLKKIESSVGVVVQVREEASKKILPNSKGKSKAKMIYFMDAKEAYDVFCENFEKYIEK